ncbi:hypothetical protein BJ742DRAFT_807023 [Cladochytrium replicatum]|nr:hypothetical protein BJ742DRAFT_807023 [Cladochytrium replicatum]
MANPIPKTASGLSITAQSRGLGAQGNTSSSALSPRSPFLLRTAQEITGDREPSQFARSELSKSVQSTGPAQKDQLRKHNLQAEERVEPQRQNLESVVKRNRSNTTSNAIAPVNLRATALSRSNSFHQGGASALSTKSNKISTPEEVVRKILSERGVLGATDPALWAVQNFTDYPAYETLRTALFAALVDQPEYPLILPPELVQMLTDEALSNDDRQK